MKIGIVGLGLIGGSLAKALAQKAEHTVAGFDADPGVLLAAMDAGVVSSELSVEECDVVFVCLHPRAAVHWMKTCDLAPGTIVADTCGVKSYISDEVRDSLLEKGLRYVGTHPMAGREVGGYASSLPELFDGASWILTEDETTDSAALQTVSSLVREAGASDVPVTSAKEHDRIIAYTSQMAHVVSNAYVKNKAALEERGFSAGSFQDLTRVAQLDPDMWTELFIANKQDLTENLDEFIKNLTAMRDAILEGCEKRLHDLLAEGSRKRIALTDMERAKVENEG